MEEKKLLSKKRRAQEQNNQSQLAETCNHLGIYYEKRSKYDKALANFKEEAKAYEKLGNSRLQIGKAHRMIGEMYMLTSDFTNAIKHENIYLKCAKEEEDMLEEQRAYATIGRVYLMYGQSLTDSTESAIPLRKAEKAFLKSLLICNKLTGLPKYELIDMEARLFLNLAVTKECLEDLDDSVQFMEKAISLCRKHDLLELLHQCYLTTAIFHDVKQNDTTKALRFLNLSLGIAERLQNRAQKMCETLLTKSAINIKMGDFQSAKAVLFKAYKLKTPDAADRANIEKQLKTLAALCYTEDELISLSSDDYEKKRKLYEKMGDGSCLLKNYTKAIDYYLKTLENAELCQCGDKVLIPIYVSLYQTYKDAKQYEDALVYLWKEYDLNKIDDPKESILTLLNIAEVYELLNKGFWSTDDIYQRARSEAQKCQNLKLEKLIVYKQIELRKQKNLSALLDNLIEEAKMCGIDVDEEVVEGESQESEDTEDSVEKNTPDIGDEICLSDLTGKIGSDSDEEKSNVDKLRNRQNRRKAQKVKRNEKGETQLHQACIAGDLVHVKRLLDCGHPINIRDNAGWTPLHEASNHGFLEIVNLLIDRGAAINDKGGKSCDGITPLHDACVNGCLEVVELLLSRGANATLRTDFNETTITCLEKWRDKVKLDPSEQIFYDKVHDRLATHLTKAGIDTESPGKLTGRVDRTPLKKIISTPIPRQTSNAKRLIGSLRTSINDYSDDSDDEQNLPKRVESFDAILNKEFPAAESDSDSCPPIQFGENDGDARDQYRNVMDNLRAGNKQLLNLSPELSPIIDTNKRKTGLLNADEVGEDWLDNDLPTNKKRRLLSLDSVAPETSTNERRNSDKMEIVSSDSEEERNVNGVYRESPDAYDMLMASSSSSSVPRRRNSRNSKSKDKFKKQQSSLLSSGFIKYSDDSLSSIKESSSEDFLSNVSLPVENIVLRSPAKPVNNVSPVKAVVSRLTSTKVKVENQIFNVPINNDLINDLTVGWLADETARRYYKLKGLRPVLRLSTEDGAIFENDDPLSVTFDTGTIASTVLEWILPSISQRYMEACQQLKCPADELIQNTIEIIQSTHNLSLTDKILNSTSIRPLFKSLQYQANLETINLANNTIEDDGVRYLAESLPTIQKLKHLNLSGNLITASGLSSLCQNVDNLPELDTLNLSFNPLKDSSVVCLAKLCTQSPKLTKLSLCSTDIGDFGESTLNFNSLIELDVSFNRFTCATLKKCLQKLNSCKMTKLNLAFCFGSKAKIDGSLDGLLSFLNAGTCDNLRELNLSGWHLDDGDLWQLITSLARSQKLDTLYLMENAQLGSVSFKLLLERLVVKHLHLEGCRKLLLNLDVETFQPRTGTSIESITMSVSYRDQEKDLQILENLWQRMMGERAKVFVKNRKAFLTLDRFNEF